MATRTSTTTGNLSAGGTWVGGIAPVAGDNIIVASGTVVTVDASISLTAAGAADAVQINGTSSVSFGELIVPDGITLTLVGVDTTNQQAMQIQRYGKLTMQPGSTMVVNSPGDFTTQVDNRGRFYAIGTVSKPITFTSPAANYSWATAVVGEAAASALHKYDRARDIATIALKYPWISNAGGTALGSLGDTSISITAVTPNALPNGPICSSEKASLSLVLAVGDYYVDYLRGIVYYYQPGQATNSTITCSYSHLAFTKTWGIVSVQDTTYNEAKFDYCNFSYMGKNTAAASTGAVVLKFKKATAVEAERVAYVKHCTFNYCWTPLHISTNTGTLADPISITDNTINAAATPETGGYAIHLYRAALDYIDISRNTIDAIGTAIGGPTLVPVTWTGITIADNVITVRPAYNSTFNGTAIENASTVVWSASTISGNTINCFGSAATVRCIMNPEGLSGADKLVIEDNDIWYPYHAAALASNCIFRGNTIYQSYHHCITPRTVDFTISTGVEVYNNLVFGEVPAADAGYDGQTLVELGYAFGGRTDDWKIYNNTIVGSPNGSFGFGQLEDSNNCDTLITRLYCVNNLISVVTGTSATGWKRTADGATVLTRLHCIQFDNNLDYNYATRYGTGVGKQGTFTKGGSNYSALTGAGRNITGVSLHFPNFAGPIAEGSGKTLDFTYTSTTDMTLTFDGGTPVQLVFGGAGTSFEVASIGTAGTYYEIVNVTGTPFSTVSNAATCPVSRWVVFLNGLAAGDVFHCSEPSSTSAIKITPRFGAGRVPVATDDFVVIESEVTLTDGADSLKAGIYFPELPTSTKQDTLIGFADHSVTGSDPLLSDADAAVATGYYLSLVSSPAVGAGTDDLYPSEDFVGTTRDAAPDIGFFEFDAGGGGGSSGSVGPGTYLRWTAGMLNNRVPPHYRR